MIDSESMESAFKKHQRQLHSIAWNFNRSTGIPEEDLFAEACLIFVKIFPKYDSEKSSLSTFIHICITNKLKRFCMKQAKTVKTCSYDADLIASDNEDENIFNESEGYLSSDMQYYIDSLVAIGPEIEHLPKKAKSICQMIFDSPQEFLDCSEGSLTYLQNKLRSMGWKWRDIWVSFQEIRQMLHSI